MNVPNRMQRLQVHRRTCVRMVLETERWQICTVVGLLYKSTIRFPHHLQSPDSDHTACSSIEWLIEYCSNRQRNCSNILLINTHTHRLTKWFIWYSSQWLDWNNNQYNTIQYNKINTILGRLPDPSCRRCPGRPRNRWLDQLRRDNGTPPADLWRRQQ